MMKTIITGLAAATAAALLLAGGAVSAPSTDIITVMNTEQVEAQSVSGGVVTTSGQLTGSNTPGEDARADWLQTIAGVQYAQENSGIIAVKRVAIDGSTQISEEIDNVGLIGAPASSMSQSDLGVHAVIYDGPAGLTHRAVNYVPFLGGAPEFVMELNVSESTFMASWNERIVTFLSSGSNLMDDNRPYMVTVQNATGLNRLIVTYVPLEDSFDASFAQSKGVGSLWVHNDLLAQLSSGTVGAGATPTTLP